MTTINQSSSVKEMLGHAGFKRQGSSWRRTLNGVTYVAEDFERRPVKYTGSVHVRVLDSFPARVTSYDTLLQMALTWGNAC